MPKHIKPTAEELEANALKAAEEAEKLKNEDNPPANPSPEVPETPQPSPTPSIEDNEPPSPSPSPESEEGKYKKKFIASSREAIILHGKNEKNEKLTNAIDDASQIKEMPEEVIKTEYPEWEEMTETEKRLAKESWINRERFNRIHQAAMEGKDIEEWSKNVDKFVEDPKSLITYPQLEGKTDEFKIFANKQSRRGADFSLLVSAFLFDVTTNTKPKKGAMFENGSGGPNDKNKPKSDKITLEQARVLRQRDYGKYREYLRAGKIETADL